MSVGEKRDVCDELAPEVQAILEEVACDPRSRLLRVPKLRVPLQYELPVTDREALLTGVERELVIVHRFRVADLLLQEVRRATSEWEASREQLAKYMMTDQEPELPDPLKWEGEARFRLGVPPAEARTKDAAFLLAECVRTSPGERPSPAQLAAASLRLVPRVSTRICLGLALHQAGQTHAGLEVLWDVVGNQPQQGLRPFAWHNIGYLERSLGRSPKAIEGYREAALATDYRGDSARSWFVEALVRGDREEMLRSGRYVEEGAPSSGAPTDHFTRSCVCQALRDGWKLGSNARRTFLTIADRLPEQIRSLGYALSKTE